MSYPDGNNETGPVYRHPSTLRERDARRGRWREASVAVTMPVDSSLSVSLRSACSANSDP